MTVRLLSAKGSTPRDGGLLSLEYLLQLLQGRTFETSNASGLSCMNHMFGGFLPPSARFRGTQQRFGHVPFFLLQKLTFFKLQK